MQGVHTLSVVDVALLDELRELLGDGFGPLLEIYVRDSASRLADLETAMAAQDSDAVRRLAHALKGSSANVGALRLTLRCKQLEDAGEAGELDRCQGLLSQVHGEWQTFVAVLKTHAG